MKLRRHPSERNLIGGNNGLSPLSSSIRRVAVVGLGGVSERCRQKYSISPRTRVCKGGHCSSPREVLSSPMSPVVGNWATPSPSIPTSPSWTKTIGRSIISQRVTDSQKAFKRYSEPIPFDLRRLTPVSFNFKQSRSSALSFGLTNTCIKDLIAEFQAYRATLKASKNKVTSNKDTPTRGRIFKTPQIKCVASSAPRRLFESSPGTCKRRASILDTKLMDADADEIDSQDFGDENAPVFRSKIRRIQWSPTSEANDSGVESMDTSSISDCSEGLDRDLLNLSFEQSKENDC